MEIFFLSSDPQKNAEFMCDVHLWETLVEALRILCTNYRIIMTEDIHQEYAEMNHFYPIEEAYTSISIWTRKSYHHYLWLCMFVKALFNELIHRKLQMRWLSEQTIFLAIMEHINYINCKLPKTSIFFPKHVIPEVFLIPYNVFTNCQYWYTKFEFFGKSWTNRETPYWFEIILNIQNGKIPRSRLKRDDHIIIQSYDTKRQRTERIYDGLRRCRYICGSSEACSHPMQSQ